MRSIDSKESDELKKTIQGLISSSNCFNHIETSLNKNKEFMKYFEEANEQLSRDNCQSLAVHYIVAIELMLEKIESLEED